MGRIIYKKAKIQTKFIAQKTKECYEPSSWVRLFESLANKDENAELAYFYVLLELEMIDEAKKGGLNAPEQESGSRTNFVR